MAQTPTPPLPPPLLTPATYLLRYQQQFRTNDLFEIGEADLRAQAADIADLFLLWNQLGKTLLLDTVADLALPLAAQRTLVVNQLARLATGGEYVLQADSNGPLWAYAGLTSTSRVRTRWLPIGDPLAQLTLFPVLVLVDRRYAAGDVVQHTFSGGQTIPLQIRQALPLPGAGLSNPVPTGLNDDPNYKPFAPLVAPGGSYVGFQLTTVPDARLLSQQQKVSPNRLYRLQRYTVSLVKGLSTFERAAVDILLWGLTATAYTPTAYAVSNTTGTITAGTYNLATDTFTVATSGPSGPSTPTTGASSVLTRLRLTYSGPNQVVELPPNTTELLFLHNEAGRGIHDDYLVLDLTATPQTLTILGGARVGDVCYGRILVGSGVVDPPDDPTDPTSQPTAFDPEALWDDNFVWDADLGG